MRTPWKDLLRAADWHRPLAVTHQPMAGERAAHTLHEATYLGLAAHGTLTPLGRALLADPRSLDDRSPICSRRSSNRPISRPI